MSELKPGDRVTSPLLVGEWEVLNVDNALPGFIVVGQERHEVMAHKINLTLVAPPPPEPPVGSVVWLDGEAWVHANDAVFAWHTHPWQEGSWSDIADRAVPAVDPTNDDHLKAAGLCRVDEVDTWMDEKGACDDTWRGKFRARFGGAS
jgi:hypothetical protein